MEKNREASFEREACNHEQAKVSAVPQATSTPIRARVHKPAAEAAAPQGNGLAIKPPAHDVQPATGCNSTNQNI